MQNICLSLLKTIQEYEEVINEAASGPQGIYIYKLEICCVLLWRGTDEKIYLIIAIQSWPLKFFHLLYTISLIVIMRKNTLFGFDILMDINIILL